MPQALDVMAGLVSGGVLNAETMRWDGLRYTHSTAVRASWPSVAPLNGQQDAGRSTWGAPV